MSVTVRLATPLRAAAGGSATLALDAADLGGLVREITERYPELAARVLRDGAFGPFVNVFVDGEDARYLDPRAELEDLEQEIATLPRARTGSAAGGGRSGREAASGLRGVGVITPEPPSGNSNGRRLSQSIGRLEQTRPDVWEWKLELRGPAP